MLAAGSIDWTMVLTSLIVGLPAIIAAIYTVRMHGQIRTPSGKSLGEVVEYAHDTAIANNMLLSKSNGPTRIADHDTLADESRTPPRVPNPTVER